MINNSTRPEVKELFDSYSQDLTRYALSILGNVDDARDAVQDTFLKYQLYEDSFNEQCSYKTWLFTITRNLCYNKLRESFRRNSGFENISFKLYDGENIDDLISLKEGLSRLSTEDNEIIYLRDFERYSYKEIAALLDMSLGNVKIRLFRAKKRLRKILKDNTDENM